MASEMHSPFDLVVHGPMRVWYVSAGDSRELMSNGECISLARDLRDLLNQVEEDLAKASGLEERVVLRPYRCWSRCY